MFLNRLFFFCLLLAVYSGFGDGPKVLVNHIGYDLRAPKRAVILGHADDSVTDFSVIDPASGKSLLTRAAQKNGPVDRWNDWCFWTADFSSIETAGTYQVECSTSIGKVSSFPFRIQPDLLEKNTLSSIIYYFKGQRCSGLLDKSDHNAKFDGSLAAANVHGGWYDATGDYGKHIGGLGFSTYFNMQPTPDAAWSLFAAYRELNERGDPSFKQFQRRLLDEAMYGADFLVRMKSPHGSFYRTVDGPGPEKRPEDRRIGKEGVGFAIKTATTKNDFSIGDTNKIAGKFPYEVGWRSGGGLSIAALAMASTFSVSGDFGKATYLKTAEDAFSFLETNNLAFNTDQHENILDDYCALLAASELYKAKRIPRYKAAADRRAGSLMNRLTKSGNYENYWRADDGERPFFHAADAGLPVMSLLEYLQVADQSTRPRVLETVKKSLEFEMAVTAEVANPFGYARQLVQTTNGVRSSAFFYPHDTETAPWWQGENARLGSMAAAARMAAKHFKNDPAFRARLQEYALNQLNWILGLNPYDCCMLHGSGRNNIAYMFFESYEYNNAPGGICNGITAGLDNPHDIAFNLGYAATGKDEDWRWSEQWLPHAAWYLYAVSLPH